jgi:hypothetical protein
MIETLPGMPAGVTGIRVSGRLSGDDLREFEPTMAELRSTDDIRIVEVIADDYEGFGPGGLVEDLKMGFREHSAFRRIAVVSNKEWVVNTLHALAWLVPGDLKIFGLDALGPAAQWAAG